MPAPYDESKHPRDDGGRFGPKDADEAEGGTGALSAHEFPTHVSRFARAEQRMVEAAHEETQRVFRDEFPEVATYELAESDSPDSPHGPLVFKTARDTDGNELDQETLDEIPERVEYSSMMMNAANSRMWRARAEDTDGLSHTFKVK